MSAFLGALGSSTDGDAAAQTVAHSHCAIYLIIEALDMRLGAEGLSACVQSRLNRSPCAGDIYVFSNARRNRVKLLLWDATGVWLAQRRLHKGKFFWPMVDKVAAVSSNSSSTSSPANETSTATLTLDEWHWLTQGVDWSRLSASVHANAHWRVA